jgi:hypothetical protein
VALPAAVPAMATWSASSPVSMWTPLPAPVPSSVTLSAPPSVSMTTTLPSPVLWIVAMFRARGGDV